MGGVHYDIKSKYEYMFKTRLSKGKYVMPTNKNIHIIKFVNKEALIVNM